MVAAFLSNIFISLLNIEALALMLIYLAKFVYLDLHLSYVLLKNVFIVRYYQVCSKYHNFVLENGDITALFCVRHTKSYVLYI